MSFTPSPLAESSQSGLKTWVNSQWKFPAFPGQFSVAINNYGIREDWSSIVQLYARVLESEMKRHWKSVFDELEKFGIEATDRTLGGMIKALKTVKDSIRKAKDDSALPAFVVDQIENEDVKGFIREDAQFLRDQRNHAAHGNRETPIRAIDLHRWRDILFSRKRLALIVSFSSI